MTPERFEDLMLTEYPAVRRAEFDLRLKVHTNEQVGALDESISAARDHADELSEKRRIAREQQQTVQKRVDQLRLEQNRLAQEKSGLESAGAIKAAVGSRLAIEVARALDQLLETGAKVDEVGAELREAEKLADSGEAECRLLEDDLRFARETERRLARARIELLTKIGSKQPA